MSQLRQKPDIKLDQYGFTLIELVIIIVTLGILAAVAVPKFADMANASKVNATRQELHAIKKAIIGDPTVTAGGAYIDRGFEGDVGFVPSRLPDLVSRPDSVAAYNALSRLGWNGPYLDSSGSAYLSDAWGNTYVYVPAARTILSVGAAHDTVGVTF